MTTKRLGAQTVLLPNTPSIAGAACVGGKKEGEGPFGKKLDAVYNDTTLGEKTWEKAESLMQKEALRRAAANAQVNMDDVNYIFAGDLLNQCIGTTFGIIDHARPFFGLYGACSTMAESLSLAAMAVDGGFADCAAAMTSSHFCSAERQYRLPLEYGGQRTPTAQWTVTGSGAVILSGDGEGPYITHVTTGIIVDAGIKDANNMGAAMAPASVIIGPYPKGRCAGRVLQNTENKGVERLYRQRCQWHNIHTVRPPVRKPVAGNNRQCGGRFDLVCVNFRRELQEITRSFINRTDAELDFKGAPCTVRVFNDGINLQSA